METLAQLNGLAELCARNARQANTRDVAQTLWRMATEYADKAAKMDGGKLPDIGPPPTLLK